MPSRARQARALPSQDPLEFPAHELKKYFRVGDRVRVMAGKCEGDSGLLLKVDEATATLYSDFGGHQVTRASLFVRPSIGRRLN